MMKLIDYSERDKVVRVSLKAMRRTAHPVPPDSHPRFYGSSYQVVAGGLEEVRGHVTVPRRPVTNYKSAAAQGRNQDESL